MKRFLNSPGHVVMTGATHLTLLICIVLAGMALYIPVRDFCDLRRDLKQTRIQLADLEVLFPLYAEVMQLDRPETWPSLALPEAGYVNEREVVTIPELFLAMAKKASLELSSVSPSVVTDDRGNRWLLVDIRANGAYPQLKPLLMDLMRLPALAGISRLEVRREQVNDQFNIRVNLALK
jgi:hypothetical protein